MTKQRSARASAIPLGDNSRQGSETSHIESTHVVPPPQGVAPHSPSSPHSPSASPSPMAAMTDDERIRAFRESLRLRFDVPKREADLVPFIMNFAQRIAADPARFGIEPEDARALLELAEQYAAAYRIAKNRETRSAPANARKDAARTIAVKAVRKRAQWIKAQPAISVEDKVKVGFANG